MFTLNRVYLIGRLAENPHIFSTDNGESLATFTLLTPIDGSEQLQRHHVLVEHQLFVTYSDSCLSAGSFVFVEGQLNQLAGDSGRSWIVISKSFGGLHPIHSHVHPPFSELAVGSNA